MTPTELLTTLEREGFALSILDNGTPNITPAGKLTAGQKTLLGEHRAGILAILRERGKPVAPAPVQAPPSAALADLLDTLRAKNFTLLIGKDSLVIAPAEMIDALHANTEPLKELFRAEMAKAGPYDKGA